MHQEHFSEALARPRARGWYVLPTAITCVSLALGFFSILGTIEGNYRQAAASLLLAMVADKLDGFVARKTGTYTAFGVQMDSLSDVISFGAAPALLIHQLALGHFGVPGAFVAILFTACTAIRLARFNISAGSADLRFFTGLPCPAAAAAAAALAWLLHDQPSVAREFSGAIAVLMALLGGAMVSTVRYISFKVLPPVWLLATLAAVLAGSLMLLGLPATVLLVFTGYALSGPLGAARILGP